MKNRVFYFAVLFCLISANLFPQKKAATQKNTNPLIGNWISNVLKEQKTKVTMSFDAKGNIQYSVAVPIKGSYIKTGNKIITMFNNPKSGAVEVDTSEISIKGDTLYQVNHTGVRKTVIKSVRVKGAAGLIGAWLSENYNGYHARQEFTPYNSLFVDLIVKSIKGKYSITGNEFTITSEDNPPMTIKYSLSGKNDVLTIKRPGLKDQLELIRVMGNK